jgi:Zn-dependent protease/predicted transcriptional regulator
MWGKSVSLFKLLGFEIRIDLSWLVIAVLVTWSLASGVFPVTYPLHDEIIYWVMGAAAAIGLFASIVFHEFWHSVIARMYGIPMKGITLFIFGGVAEMNDQPKSPGAELLMSIAGPISSVILGGLFYLVSMMPLMPEAAGHVTSWLGGINIVLAAFNMVPAFPLDGGRVLRSILWSIKKDLQWSTKIAAWFGTAFGVFLILMGVVNAFYGNLIGGIWMVLIGMFIRAASRVSWQQVLVRKGLEGQHVDRFVEKEPIAVSAAISIRELIESYFYRYHCKMFPVTRNGMVLGCVTTGQASKVAQDEWDSSTVSSILEPPSPENSISPEAEAIEAVNVMGRTGNSRLMVVDGERLVGIINLKDMLDFLATRLDLQGRAG